MTKMDYCISETFRYQSFFLDLTFVFFLLLRNQGRKLGSKLGKYLDYRPYIHLYASEH